MAAAGSSSGVVVVDASLALKWVLMEEDSERASMVLDHWVESGTRLIVPAHFLIECTAVLTKLWRRGELSIQEAQEAFGTVYALEIEVISDKRLSFHALEAADRYGVLSGYDAHYVALTALYGCELWTADERLYSAVRARASFVRLLREYAP